MRVLPTDIAAAIADNYPQWSETGRLASLDIEVLMDLETKLYDRAYDSEFVDNEQDADEAYERLQEVTDILTAIGTDY